MFAHHVVTIGLVAGSGAHGYFRIAVVILAVHDTSDIGVDMLKLVNYLQVCSSSFNSQPEHRSCLFHTFL